MAETLKAHLINAQQARAPFENAWRHAKALLMAGHKLTLELRPQTRSNDQNALLHALLGEIAATQEWAGSRRDIDTWKRLLTAAWLRARGESVELLPALDGHGIDVVFRHTSKLTRAECAELVDFVSAWGAEHGVQFTAPKSWEEPE